MNQLKCNNCKYTYSAPTTANAIYICPNCNKYAGCECEYGYGPITPCNIFVGEKEVAVIEAVKMEGPTSYYLQSDILELKKVLRKGYSNLEVYKEAAEIIEDYLQRIAGV